MFDNDEIRVTPNYFPLNKGRTKWEILEARRFSLRLALQEVERTMTGLEQTPCNLTCQGCGTVLETEQDFAAHFIVTDERYLNLGECPNRGR